MKNPASGPGRQAWLLGRASECALLDDLISDVRRGESRALVIRGEAGIGKTALLEHLVESTSDLTVLRAVGMESEMELAYASLHQVCAPLLDRLETLRQPQRQALETVFGLGPGARPDGFLVGLGVLSLLSEAAEERPLLCIVDDAQWLDHASVRTLAFVARRLQADPVGIVFAAREPGEELQHLPALDVRGLFSGDARALLGSAVRIKLDAQVRERIIAETHGNPLALLELPQGLTATQLAGGFGSADAPRLPERIEKSFVRRITALPDDARRLLLVAAAEPLGDPVLLVRAAERLSVAVSSVETETDGLLVIGARVAFYHPLVRSAVYKTATAEERRAAHLALAEATDPAADPDRRAWHLASAAPGPDELVASELERSAGRAQARGGLAASTAFLERAAALTPDPARRPERALAAAQANLQAGAFNAALALLAVAEAGALDDFQQAQAELLRGHVAFGSGRVGDAPPLLLNAARRLEELDMELARETYLTAWGAAIVAAYELGEGGVLLEICDAARSLRPPPDNSRPVDLLLDGLARLFTEGHAASTASLQRAVSALTSITIEDVLRWGWVAAPVAATIWDVEALYAIATREVQLVQEAGALAQLPLYLTQLSTALIWMGDFERAAALIAESEAVATATGSGLPPHTLIWLWGLEGREAETCAAIARSTEEAMANGRPVNTQSQVAAAVLYNGLGRYHSAASAAARASSDVFNPWTVMAALPELVEAAARNGDTAVASDALARLVETTRSGTDWALGVEAYSRALLSDGGIAEDLYRLAIDRLGRTRLRPYLARAHLLYGEWLRRGNRRHNARQQLRAAYNHFSSIGMEAFAERARLELLATGEKARKRTIEARDDLTEQERQIARLAQEGLSNAQIAERLFLSSRTIEWHLSKVFTKLEIHSRRELMSQAFQPPLAADPDLASPHIEAARGREFSRVPRST